MSHDYKPAKWIPHSHYWEGRSGHSVKYIILHGSASPGIETAEAMAQEYASGHGQFGPHFIVGRDGIVVQSALVANAAWSGGQVERGADWWWNTRGNPNLETISIVLVKPDKDNSLGLTDAQEFAARELIDHLVQTYHIPPRFADESGGITGQFSIAPLTQRFSPGPFPWDDLWAYLTRTRSFPLGGKSTSGAPLEAPQGSGASASTPLVRSRAVIVDLPGFAPLVQGIHRASSPPPFPQGATLGQTATWIGSAGGSIGLRVLLVVGGLILVYGLIMAVVRKNAWMGTSGAGLDTPSLLFLSKGRL